VISVDASQAQRKVQADPVGLRSPGWNREEGFSARETGAARKAFFRGGSSVFRLFLGYAKPFCPKEGFTKK